MLRSRSSITEQIIVSDTFTKSFARLKVLKGKTFPTKDYFLVTSYDSESE